MSSETPRASRQRVFAALLAAVAAGAWLVRMAPFLWRGGHDLQLGYDESVYFTSAILWLDGLVPYRDFVYVHPPGFLSLLAGVSAFTGGGDLATRLDLVRWMVIAIATANVVLVGRLARSGFGPVAGVAAAVFYATHPATALFERRAFIEPTLNFACLALATVWLRGAWDRSTKPAIGSGLSVAAAVSLKLWGAFWLLPCLLSLPAGFTRRQARVMILAACVAGALVVLPLALQAPEAYVTQTGLFQLWRPPDGISRLDRVTELLSVEPASLFSTACLLAGLAAAAWRVRDASRDARFWLAAWATIAAAFMAAPAFFGHYVQHLMAPGAVLMGLGVSTVWQRTSTWTRAPRALLGAIACVAVLASLALVMREPVRSPLRPPAAALIGAQVPRDAGLQAINPMWNVIGNRLPRRTTGHPVMVDSYSVMLLAAVGNGSRFADARTALQSPAAQAAARAAFLDNDVVGTSSSSRWQLSPETWRWLGACYVKTANVERPGTSERFELWTRRPGACRP